MIRRILSNILSTQEYSCLFSRNKWRHDIYFKYNIHTSQPEIPRVLDTYSYDNRGLFYLILDLVGVVHPKDNRWAKYFGGAAIGLSFVTLCYAIDNADKYSFKNELVLANIRSLVLMGLTALVLPKYFPQIRELIPIYVFLTIYSSFACYRKNFHPRKEMLSSPKYDVKEDINLLHLLLPGIQFSLLKMLGATSIATHLGLNYVLIAAFNILFSCMSSTPEEYKFGATTALPLSLLASFCHCIILCNLASIMHPISLYSLSFICVLIPTILQSYQTTRTNIREFRYKNEGSHYEISKYAVFYESNSMHGILIFPLILLSQLYLFLRPKTAPYYYYFPRKNEEITSKYVSHLEDQKYALYSYSNELNPKPKDSKN